MATPNEDQIKQLTHEIVRLEELADAVVYESATDPIDEPFYYVRQRELDALEAYVRRVKPSSPRVGRE